MWFYPRILQESVLRNLLLCLMPRYYCDISKNIKFTMIVISQVISKCSTFLCAIMQNDLVFPARGCEYIYSTTKICIGFGTDHFTGSKLYDFRGLKVRFLASTRTSWYVCFGGIIRNPKTLLYKTQMLWQDCEWLFIWLATLWRL